METFSALLAICVGNSPVTGEFPSQRPVMRSFGGFFDLRLNKRLSKQSWGWWLETPSSSLWRHCNEPGMIYCFLLDQLQFVTSCPRDRLNIKMPLCQYRDSHYKVPRPSYLYNRIPIPWNIIFILRQGPVHPKYPITKTSEWARRRLTSPASGLFTQPFVQA